MSNSSSLSALISQSNVLTPEKKQIYIQVLPYLSIEASSQLESVLAGAEDQVRQIREREEKAISDINVAISSEMSDLVRVELRAAQTQAEADELKATEEILTKLDNL